MRTARRPRRFPRRTAVVLAVLAAALSIPRACAAAAGFPGTGHPAAVHAGHARVSHPAEAVTVAARQPAAVAGGACSVPGIGDIGSLLGLCTLGQSGLTGELNNICQPSLPDPEQANSGIDAMIRPPAGPGRQPATLYSSYGVAGQFWAATNLQCSDMTSLIGNNVASMVFDIAKAIDRVTITIYQAAAGNGILSWLTTVVDKLITSLGNAIYFPYLAAVVIIGAIWLAWQGLIRKRGTRTIEGTIWMVLACAAAIWLIGRPGDFTGAGSTVSGGISQALDAAFARLPAPSQGNCLPVTPSDPQVQPAGYAFSPGSAIVGENANELWTVLVCKPWLAGEFGTTAFGTGGSRTVVNTYGRQLLWAQAIATNENPSSALIQAKQATYSGIAASIQQNDPGIYPLFQGKQWTTRLEIALAALFAAAIAGVLVLLIAVTLILLKLGFLLLLVAGPFFLLIGTHPGFGRVVALRWFEMLVGVLLKQAAVALVLSVLLYAYSLIMGASDAVLPWALKILMIALVTIAVFIYRRPFQHLFSAVGYGMMGSTERAEAGLERSRAALRANTLGAAAAAAAFVPGVAAYRAARWARRHPAQTAGLAAAAGGGGAAAGAAAAMPAAAGTDGGDEASAAGAGAAEGAGSRLAPAPASRARAWAATAAGDGSGRPAPPLNLPSRETGGPAAGAQSRGGQPGPWRAGRAGASRSGAAQPGAAHSGSAQPGAAQSGAAQSGPAPPRSAARIPVRAQPARTPPAGPAALRPGATAASPAAPAGAAPAPAPGRPATGWPWRPRQEPARPGPAPRTPAARGQSGPWTGSPAGRQSAPPARPPAPAPPPAPVPARPQAAPRVRQPAPAPARQPAAAPARQPAPAPVRQPAPARQAAPAPASGRPPAAAPVPQRGAPARWPSAPARGRDGDGAAPGPPLSGNPAASEPGSAGPFWLRPIRRRK